jgi:hypothetical protein
MEELSAKDIDCRDYDTKPRPMSYEFNLRVL